MSATASVLKSPQDASKTSCLTDCRKEALSRSVYNARSISWGLPEFEALLRRADTSQEPVSLGDNEAQEGTKTKVPSQSSSRSLWSALRSAARRSRRLLHAWRSRGHNSDVTSNLRETKGHSVRDRGGAAPVRTSGNIPDVAKSSISDAADDDDILTAKQEIDKTLGTIIEMCADMHHYQPALSADEEMEQWQREADTIKENDVPFAEWTEGWGPQKLYDHFERRLTSAPGPLADGVAIACLAAQELLIYGAEGDLTTWEKLDDLASILGQADKKSTVEELTERKVKRTNGSSGLSSVFELADREFCGTVSEMDERAKASAVKYLECLDSVVPKGTTLDEVSTSGITGAAWWNGNKINWTRGGVETSRTNVRDFASEQSGI